jgi:hypothetical protein
MVWKINGSFMQTCLGERKQTILVSEQLATQNEVRGPAAAAGYGSLV